LLPIQTTTGGTLGRSRRLQFSTFLSYSVDTLAVAMRFGETGRSSETSAHVQSRFFNAAIDQSITGWAYIICGRFLFPE
jgi:hypothetical protein